jgi:DNA (cytosine-5)-methyltransferase 1
MKDKTNGMALFAGGGGLELGLSLALGDAYRCVVYVERDAYAAATLVARMEDQALDPAPIWDDVGTFDGRPWRGVVDLISGGFPCQDISCAGQREGLVKGNRSGLWFEYARIIGEVGPRLVFVENVAALAIRGLDVVLGTLADLGFDADWMPLAAGDLGAGHERERIFILAHSGSRLPERRRGSGEVQCAAAGPEGETRQRERGWDASGDRCQDVADAVRLPSRERSGRERVLDCNQEMGDAEGRGRVQTLCGSEEGVRPFPPGPSDREAWRATLEANPALEPSVCGVADGVAHRMDRLRLCGNGVVPVVASVAFRTLAGRLGIM